MYVCVEERAPHTHHSHTILISHASLYSLGPLSLSLTLKLSHSLKPLRLKPTRILFMLKKSGNRCSKSFGIETMRLYSCRDPYFQNFFKGLINVRINVESFWVYMIWGLNGGIGSWGSISAICVFLLSIYAARIFNCCCLWTIFLR